MTIKKHQWLNYGRSGGTAEITVRDDNGAKIDYFKFNSSDKKQTGKIAQILRDKYDIDFSPTISVEESINADKEEEQEEYNWLS